MKMKLRRIKERVFTFLFIGALVLSLNSLCVNAAYSSKDGRTMNYYLRNSGSTWSAETYCYEDGASFVSMFLYSQKNCGGTVKWSDSYTCYERTVVPGSSLSWYYAGLSKSLLFAKSARSGHALKDPDTKMPCLSTLYLSKNK